MEYPGVMCLYRRNNSTVRLLLQNNADCNQCDVWNNADVNQCDEDGISPLYVTCKGGHTDTVELLLQNNADINQYNNRFESSLFIACTGGHTDTVEFLLQNNADLSQCDYIGNYPLYVASANGHKDRVELLLKNNADVSKCNNCADNCKPSGKFWDPNIPSWYGCIRPDDPNLEDTYQGTIETVKLLLAWNADVSLCDKNGQTPLDYARKSQSMAI
ncbi:Hypothetical predicted protein, partial [Mytilus galloprovincialis]